ncbi:tetratricopeptide repeat protein [Lentzea sp. NPDC006480]|uniref:helix-turn-helix transcriptional regulator n=1 Tax=Lentzea sp. NPDC006480 TaxID=3157176 RepID=UPI0033BE1A26
MFGEAFFVMCVVCGAECANRYCSNACRQRAYRSRSKQSSVPRVVAGPADSFLGREDEWVRLGKLLRRSRLVTLVGPPGVGKSRLAREFAAKRPNALVVLDNCDHHVEACGRLAEQLLSADPQLRVLVTSREQLRITGEQLLHVGPLFPADSAQLFLDRSSGLTARTDVIDQICARLDRSPLAIELAARLVPALRPADLLTRLDQRRLDLLATGSRTGHPRHASLRAAVEWSWVTLTESERRVLRQLSVYADGFDLDAVPDVGVTASLVTKSLLVPPDEHGRYRMLASIRAYAFERLVEAGELDVACDRARDRLAVLAHAVLDPVFTPAAAVGRAALDRANFAQAARVAAEQGDERELLFATTLALCWAQAGDTARGRRRLNNALARATGSPHRSVALTHAGWLAASEDDHEEALALCTAAVDAAEERSHLARALNALAGVHMARGEFAEARAAYSRCLELLELPLDRATVQHNLSWTELQSGDVTRAEWLVGEALPIYREAADAGKLAAILHTAGALALRRDDVDSAEERFQEALDKAPDEHVLPYVLQGLAITAVRREEPERALRLLGAVKGGRGGQDPCWRQDVADALSAASAALPAAKARAALRGVPRDDSPLTPREREIAAMVARGDTNRQIAKRMQVSERTVEARLTQIRAKLGLRTRTQIATWLLTRSA